MSVLFRTVILLTIANVFMTFAWYGHLKNLNNRTWYVAALVSWGVALFEYLFQVPANRIGFTQLNLRATEDHSGSDYLVGFRAVCSSLYAPAL